MAVSVEERGKQLYVTLHRPKVRHAIDLEVIRGLEEAVDRFETDRNLSALVFRTTGSSCFSAGGDLAAFQQLDSVELLEKVFGRIRSLLLRLEEQDRWTVAAIDGDAYGGGWELAMAFDFRFASAHSKLCFSQATFHLSPGWGGMTRLIERVGRQRALRFLSTQAHLDAKSCFELGLVDGVYAGKEFNAATFRFVEELVIQNRSVISALKRGVHQCHVQNRRESMEQEFREFERLWFAREHTDAVAHFLDSRARADRNGT
jgi:enoyl-CoA hydratase